MSLSETRIVLFEKAGFKKNFHVLLDGIETHINDSKRFNNKCVLISPVWIRNKLVRKILYENGYRIYKELAYEVKISWD